MRTAARADQRFLGLISLPRAQINPFTELIKRVGLALGLILLSALIVWIDGDSYVDNTAGDGVSFLDAVYYSTVTVTTTGYGDITPVKAHARLINTVVVTPLRIAFLVLLVGTTIEVLANEGARRMADARWRRRMNNHTVVIGYGTKGRSAVNTMRGNGLDVDTIVVIDSKRDAVVVANRDGVAALEGDATSRDLLHRAEILKAQKVIITLDRDDAAILTTLTVRQLNPKATIVVSVREHENVPLVRQSGATAVVTSSDTVGRLMGLSAVSPDIGTVIEDLLSVGKGLEVIQRLARPDDIGLDPALSSEERILAVIRNGTLNRFFDTSAARIETGDELIVVREARTRPVD